MSKLRHEMLRGRSRGGGMAFSLIELLVVLAVIGILIGMVYGVVRSGRDKAREVHCRNNLRQWGQVLNQFYEDHAGFFMAANVFRGYKSIQSGGDPNIVKMWTGQYNQDGSPIEIEVDLRMWDGGLASVGGVDSGREGLSLLNFIFSYVYPRPLIDCSPQTYAYFGEAGKIPFLGDISPDSTIAYCPMTYNGLTYFLTNSAKFKGYRQEWDKYAGVYYYIPDPGRFATYAINVHYASAHRKDVPGNAIAFCDWNFKEGWGNEVVYSKTNWNFTNTKGSVPGAVQGRAKNDIGARTEVGFHHAHGSYVGANVYCFDGHVEWVSKTNEPGDPTGKSIASSNLWF